MVYTPEDKQSQATSTTQNSQQATAASMIGEETVGVSSTTQVRDASSRNVDDHAQQANAPDDATRDIEIDNVEEQGPSKSVLFVVHSRTMKLENGFQPIAPPDEGQTHPFTQHNVLDADWAKFLSDIQESAKYMAKPHTPGISSLPGLFSALNLGEDAIQDTPAPPLSGVHPATVIEMWNEHFFHPRSLDIVLAKGTYSLSGDNHTPPPDMCHIRTPGEDRPFWTHFPPHGFPPQPLMAPPFMCNMPHHPPFMGNMPPQPPHMFPHGGPFSHMFGHENPLNPRGGHGPMGGRGGGPGGRGRGGFHFDRTSFDGFMGGRGGFGSRGRGGHRGRGGFGHFGHHEQHGPQDEEACGPFGSFGFGGPEEFDPSSMNYGNFDNEDFVDVCGDEEGDNKAGRKRSDSVSSDSSTSTMSGDEVEKDKQDKGKEAGQDEKREDSKRRKRSFKDHHHHHHHRHGRRSFGAGFERGHRHEHHRAHDDAGSASRLAFMRGRFGHMGPGMRGHGRGFMGRGGGRGHHHFHGFFNFADDGYYRLIVVDNSA